MRTDTIEDASVRLIRHPSFFRLLTGSTTPVKRLTVKRLTVVSGRNNLSKRVSIKDVAKAADVSTATVSNVFSGKKPVNADLAQKVRAVAKQLDYKVNKVASHLRSGRNSVVCVLVPDLADPFFTAIITEVEHLARIDGFEVIVGNSDDEVEVERSRMEALLAWEPAGAIVIPCTDAAPEVLNADPSPPCILVDRISDAIRLDTVTVDNFGAGEKAGRHVASFGHRNVLLAASNMSLSAIKQRAAGVQRGVADAGGLVRIVELGSNPERGAETLATWLRMNDAPTAIVATNDMTTLAVLRCVADRRDDLPRDMSVVGFDDYAWMAARRTKITAIRQPVEKIAAAAWRQLKRRIDGHDEPTVNTILDCDLIIRDSVAEPGKTTKHWEGN
jgi:LacI family transcriptional regulator